jgi:small neutral amino acid transporter SnatA (MarC family)
MVLLGASESKASAIGWLVVALALTIGICAVPYRRQTAWTATARILGALLVILAAALVVAGIRDV